MVEVVINQNDGFVSITAVGGELDVDFDFPIYEKSHLRIIRTRSGTSADLVLNTDYTIADNQLELTAGGSAVLIGSATPAVAADVYTLLLNVPESRTTDFTQAGDFLAATLNRELDLYAQMSQQLRRDVDKSAKLPDNSTISTLTLPEPEDAKVIGWDGVDGTMINYSVADIDVSLVTAFAATILNDTTATEVLETLGIGTAWTSWTPVLSANSGTIATYTATGRYKTMGKTCFVEIDASIVSNGTGSGSLTSTLPFTSAARKYFLGGREVAGTGKAVTGYIQSSQAQVGFNYYDNVYPGAAGTTFVLTGVYETV